MPFEDLPSDMRQQVISYLSTNELRSMMTISKQTQLDAVTVLEKSMRANKLAARKMQNLASSIDEIKNPQLLADPITTNKLANFFLLRRNDLFTSMTDRNEFEFKNESSVRICQLIICEAFIKFFRDPMNQNAKEELDEVSSNISSRNGSYFEAWHNLVILAENNGLSWPTVFTALAFAGLAYLIQQFNPS